MSQTEITYDEVKTQEKRMETPPIISGPIRNKNGAQFPTGLRLLLAFFGTSCVLLVLVVIILSVYITHEQRRQSGVLSRQNLELQAEKAALERRTAELYRDMKRLNWTIGVILEHDTFLVAEHCPHKECQPCLDDWVPFQSNCYLFTKHTSYYKWRSWDLSHKFCIEKNAELVVIDSQEEQEFINNNTERYHSDEKHGYWMGLKKDTKGMWTWVNGRNVSMTYWSTDLPGYKMACGLTNPHMSSMSSWDKSSCTMQNRWICEKRALITPD